MSNLPIHRVLRPESLTAIGILAASAALLISALRLPPMSALLPIAMLVVLVVLAIAMLAMDQRKAMVAASGTQVARIRMRVVGAFAAIGLYVVAVDFVGFYPSTAIAVFGISYAFGYRNVLRLLFGTAVVLGGIYLIFGFAMEQAFQIGRAHV